MIGEDRYLRFKELVDQNGSINVDKMTNEGFDLEEIDDFCFRLYREEYAAHREFMKVKKLGER